MKPKKPPKTITITHQQLTNIILNTIALTLLTTKLINTLINHYHQ